MQVPYMHLHHILLFPAESHTAIFKVGQGTAVLSSRLRKLDTFLFRHSQYEIPDRLIRRKL